MENEEGFSERTRENNEMTAVTPVESEHWEILQGR